MDKLLVLLLLLGLLISLYWYNIKTTFIEESQPKNKIEYIDEEENDIYDSDETNNSDFTLRSNSDFSLADLNTIDEKAYSEESTNNSNISVFSHNA